MPWWAWKDASERLTMMVDRAHRVIADPSTHLNWHRVTPEPPKPPVLLPARFANVLVGPDGRPIEGAK
jgi:hypothetical protein